MGADARVFIFDYERFRSEIVPAFEAALRGDAMPEWLLALCRNPAGGWDGIEQQLGRTVQADLPRDCTEMVALGYHGPYIDPWSWSDDSACRSNTCPWLFRCPFHRRGSLNARQEVSWLLAAALSERCVGRGRFVGRSMNIRHYDRFLHRYQGAKIDRFRQLLERLDGRGRLVGLGGSLGDGLYGWLDPEETRELIDCAAALDLPQVPADFPAMASYFEWWGSIEPPPDGYPFDQLSLRFVVNVAILASQVGFGILWGNDFFDPLERDLLPDSGAPG